ncbi:lipase member K-like [Haemaphysalis longicornis]
MAQITTLSTFFAVICLHSQSLLRAAASNAPPETCIGKVDMDACRNVTEIISSKGYPVQEHNAVTSDGYVLKVIRIPNGRASPGTNGRPIVFLLHSLLGSSTDFVLNIPDENLGYILADAGYDVWMGNVRGNTYSSHLNLTKEDDMFWEFTFDEMIHMDVPAMIDYVLNATQQENLIYVGHSQGNQVLFGFLSERPDYQRKIRLFCALAPVTTATYLKSPVRALVPFANEIKLVQQKHFQKYDHGPAGNRQLYGQERPPEYNVSSVNVPVGLFWGLNDWIATPEDVRGLAKKLPKVVLDYQTRLPVLISHVPAGTSTKNLAHFAQIRPPEYDLTQVTAPAALFYSVNDVFCNLKDIRHLQEKLPNVVLNHKVSDRRFSQLDFNLGVHARREVYEPMMRFMQGYSGRAELQKLRYLADAEAGPRAQAVVILEGTSGGCDGQGNRDAGEKRHDVKRDESVPTVDRHFGDKFDEVAGVLDVDGRFADEREENLMKEVGHGSKW